MLFTDRRGVAVECEGARPDDDATLDRLRDLLMVTLHRNGISTRKIGKVLNVDQKTVLNKINAVPPETRDFYTRFGLSRFLSVSNSPFATAEG